MKRRMVHILSYILSISFNCSANSCVKQLSIIVIICVICLATGCATKIPITRYDGTVIWVNTYKYGDHNMYYKVERYENGIIKSESYGYERKISPTLGEIGAVAKAVLSGAKEAL